MKRKSIDAVPIWFVSKKIKPEKCITGDTLAPEKKALIITGDARGSQREFGSDYASREAVLSYDNLNVNFFLPSSQKNITYGQSVIECLLLKS